jgi:protein arginine kinase activator
LKLELCAECARKEGLLLPDYKISLLTPEKVEKLLNQRGHNRPFNPKCPSCGHEYADFRIRKTAGCADCWRTFTDLYYGETSSGWQYKGKGSMELSGKEGRSLPEKTRLSLKIESMRSKLNVLVSNEKYEEAIKVRDTIEGMEKEIRSLSNSLK